MQYNLLMPMRATKHYDRWIGDEHLTDVARLAEEAGFDGVSVPEHPMPADSWLATGGHHCFDPFVALSFMGAVTSRVKLITYVLVSAYRHPYVTAKALGSLDTLSDGRVIAGMAAGYLKPEFEVLDADWDERGARFDAALDAMRAAWSGETVDIDGPFAAHGHTQLPAPAQPGGPPVWIGGNSGAARRRAALLADGWMPIGQPPEMAEITGTPALETIERLGALIAEGNARRAEIGRGPLDVCVAPFGNQPDVGAYAKLVRDDLAAYEDAGVTWCTIEPQVRSFAEFRDAVHRFADELIT
ncbi:MAG TPA: TIGR03619 family F420-dependent LLM class oxidoreductase [Acidimicrobiia bacterium]|nr:TIGR03619 family F420-dependent LLM class oxidoreductase [Acidimicrobiia bacterium]